MVSVITVNYRQAKVTCALLDSIRRENRYADLEVIVVDNGAEIDETKLFQRHYPGVKVLVSQKNLGFAGGNNLGIKAAQGDWLLFLNNDTEWTSGLLESLLDHMSKHPRTGVVSPKIRYYHDAQRIQYAGFTKMNPLTGRNRAIGKNELDEGQHDQPAQTAYAHGAAMLVSREAINNAGMMPEEFFLYYEELDWCSRIQRAGFEIWYQPQALVYHKESASVGKLSPLKVFYQTRNRLIFMRNNNSKANYTGFLLFFYLVALPVNSVRILLRRDIAMVSAYWRGCVTGIWV